MHAATHLNTIRVQMGTLHMWQFAKRTHHEYHIIYEAALYHVLYHCGPCNECRHRVRGLRISPLCSDYIQYDSS